MPGVIDTGGPRVLLNRVESPNCPIPRAKTILSFPRSCQSICHVRKYQRRVTIDASHRFTESVAVAAVLRGSSNDETAAVNIPGNDDENEFFNDEKSPPVSTTSSNDLERRLVVRHQRTHRFRDQKHYDARQRREINRGKRLLYEIHRDRHDVLLAKCDDTREISVSLGKEETSMVDRHDETDRRWTSTFLLHEKETDVITTNATGNLTRNSRDNDNELMKRSSIIVERLFGGCEREKERVTTYRRVEESSSAVISSQRGENCAEYECRCDCECFRRIAGGSLTGRSDCASERTTRERRMTERPRVRGKGRSYVELAFLLFLVVFGHGSLFRSNIGLFGGKSAIIGAGLGALTIGTFVGAVGAVPVDLDAGVRAERSANLSHITGVSRKIQMYVKNRHLQILRDGTVNGSNDDTSEYTIFQRTSVSRGQLRIQGVATCLYLCMDSCGLLYGSREYTEECVFNETLEQHNYNTYSSVRWSTPKKSLYLGLNRRGQPRRVQAKGHNLGRLSAYARVLTRVAPPERVEALQARMLGAQHNLRHHHNSHRHRKMETGEREQSHQQEEQRQQQQTICPKLPAQEKDGRDKFRCRKRKKRKKWKRRCNEGEKPGPHCGVIEIHGRATNTALIKSQSTGDGGTTQSKRSCEGEASEELCRKQALDAPAKKRKSRIETIKTSAGTRDKQQQQQQQQSSSKSKKETRMKKPEATLNSEDGSANENGTTRERVNGPNGGKRKRPEGTSKQRTSMRKKINGRPTRTTVGSFNMVAVTSPSSWYPTVATTPSNEQSSLLRRTKTAGYSTKNSVTGSMSKEEIESRESLRRGKSQEVELTIFRADISRHETITESSNESYSAAVSSLTNDWSIETSDEVKSDESTLDDETTTTVSVNDYSTIMTTMDTTPPARTENYTRPTTQSILSSIEITDTEIIDEIENSTRLDESRNFHSETRSSYGRLAM